MIEVRSLYYQYDARLALEDVSFTLTPGSITALVGPNGAGKSTLLRCMAALDVPLSGQVLLWDLDTQDDPRACHRLLAYLADHYGLYDDLTVEQSLRFMALAHALPEPEIAGRILSLLEQLDLMDLRARRASELSRGQRQRLAIAQAIVHKPRLLLLDEPAAGLDPEARLELAQLLKRLGAEGITILVSSHILAELDDYSTHMLSLRDGRIVSHRPVGAAAGLPWFRLSLSRPAPGLDAVLRAQPGVGEVRAAEDGYEFQCDGGADARRELLRTLILRDVPVCGLGPVVENMQDIYFAEHREARR